MYWKGYSQEDYQREGIDAVDRVRSVKEKANELIKEAVKNQVPCFIIIAPGNLNMTRAVGKTESGWLDDFHHIYVQLLNKMAGEICESLNCLRKIACEPGDASQSIIDEFIAETMDYSEEDVPPEDYEGDTSG